MQLRRTCSHRLAHTARLFMPVSWRSARRLPVMWLRTALFPDMSTISIGQPRRVYPEIVDIGDDISVEHPPARGVVTTVRGVVARREDHGQIRYYLTAEGATLLAWEPHRKTKVKVTLFGREQYPQETLDWLDETRQRSA